MKLNAYSIYDRKALVYHPPFFAVSHAVAIRTLSDTLSQGESQLSRHPNDFVMYFVGIYDDATGVFLTHSPLEHVKDVNALIQRPPALPFDVHPSSKEAIKTAAGVDARLGEE